MGKLKNLQRTTDSGKWSRPAIRRNMFKNYPAAPNMGIGSPYQEDLPSGLEMTSTQGERLTIIIKSASDSTHEDLKIHCHFDAVVKDVKDLVEKNHFYHPPAKEQKLIYAGHILQDAQPIGKALTQNLPSDLADTTFTVHLMCASKSNIPKSQSNSMQPKVRKAKMESNPSNPDVANSQSPPPYTSSDDMYAMHQAYVNQMMLFFNQWNMHAGGPPFSQSTHPSVFQPGESVNNWNSFSHPQDIPVNANAEGMNIGHGNPAAGNNINEVIRAAREEEENGRDHLEWAYDFIRFAMIFSVVHYYASFPRLLIVVVLVAVVLLLQRRRAHNAQAQEENVPENMANNERDRNNQEHRNASETNGNDGGSDDQGRCENTTSEGPVETKERLSGEGAIHSEEVSRNDAENENRSGAIEEGLSNRPTLEPAPRVNIRDVSWTFLSTFFSSLIPELQQNN